MKYNPGDQFKEVLKITNINKQTNFINITAISSDGQEFNMNYRLGNIELFVNQLYEFIGDVSKKEEKEKLYFNLAEINNLDKNYSLEEIFDIYKKFLKVNKLLDIFKIKKHLDLVITNIKNDIIRNIVEEIFYPNEKKFYTSPAGKAHHHAYLGGLAHHTNTMLELAEKIAAIYPFLNKDLLFASVILHDYAKTEEISGVNGDYTIEGSLLGHLSMGQSLIDEAAFKLNYKNTEEVLCLKHMLITHHGLPEFGAFKKPQLPEGVALWLIDNIDSRLNAIQSELRYTLDGEFTNKINAIDKTKVYKARFSNTNKKEK